MNTEYTHSNASAKQTPSLHILIADDEADMRTLLSDALRFLGHHIYAVADGKAALEVAQNQPLDVALVDVVMPAPSGADLVSKLRTDQPWLYTIIMTAHSETTAGYAAQALPACEYVPKPITLLRLQALMSKAAAQLAGRPQGLRVLTRREQEVLRLVAQGHSDAEIATTLMCQRRTVNNHVRRICKRLAVSNRTEAAVAWTRYTYSHKFIS